MFEQDRVCLDIRASHLETIISLMAGKIETDRCVMDHLSRRCDDEGKKCAEQLAASRQLADDLAKLQEEHRALERRYAELFSACARLTETEAER